MKMTKKQQPPPPVLASARTLWYAVKDEEVIFIDRISLYVVGERLGEVPCLAICENYSKEKEIFASSLFHVGSLKSSLPAIR
jgi:hypothetical protein